ncbi:hypothetical protein GYY_05575 [Methanococcus maripaludis X1]|uniref:Uncharacterized protein n=1 Tax=Methanococcus maripaludis X1 TaxID=1053692 RepID=G0H099_METMI|nr:hypothetical protein GYY_05575 [Methanococcus maripaludis X1]
MLVILQVILLALQYIFIIFPSLVSMLVILQVILLE